MSFSVDRSRLGVLLATFAVPIALAACSSSDGSGAPAGDAQTGQMLVQQSGCANCHQSSNAADGVLSGSDQPAHGTMTYGPNLTPDEETGLGAWTDQQIGDAVRKGVDDAGAPLCSSMPKYGTLSDGDVGHVVAYLRSLAPVRRVVPDGSCGD